MKFMIIQTVHIPHKPLSFLKGMFYFICMPYTVREYCINKTFVLKFAKKEKPPEIIDLYL